MSVVLASRSPTRQSTRTLRQKAAQRRLLFRRHAKQVNRWNIPDWLEREVLDRDTRCVYCGVEFVTPAPSRKTKPSWEHIVNDERIITRENIARCCMSCNASKGAKLLSVWLESTYCRKRNITQDTVALVVKKALVNPPTWGASTA